MRLIDADAFKQENKDLLQCDFPYKCEETLEELIDAAPTIESPEQKWIPCSERMPELYETVLAWLQTCTNSDYQIAYRDYDDHWSSDGIPVYGKVLAWMPLPEIYEEEKNND